MEEYIKNIDLQTVSMQTLAFIGDSVYDLYIRTYLASQANEKAGKLHKKAISYVSAKAQANIVDNISDKLTEEEMQIYKRGRNTNISTNKHVDIVQYKKATGKRLPMMKIQYPGPSLWQSMQFPSDSYNKVYQISSNDTHLKHKISPASRKNSTKSGGLHLKVFFSFPESD
jgi:ribonuclease-3 family protein